MRKLFTLLAVAGTFAFASCEKKAETSAADSSATVIETPADTTTMAPADTTAMAPADTTAAAPATEEVKK